MDASPKRLGPEKDCAGKGQNHINDSPVLSSERAPHKNSTCQTVINIWSWTPYGARHQDLLTVWPSVAMWFDFDLELTVKDKTQGIYFSHSRRPSESHLTLNGRNIPLVKSVKYLGVIFDKEVTWRLHIEMIEAKAFRTFIRIYFLFGSERLCTNIKLTLYKALIGV
jgi:hypothetical protein